MQNSRPTLVPTPDLCPRKKRDLVNPGGGVLPCFVIPPASGTASQGEVGVGSGLDEEYR